jgi:cobalt-zinc-cadmium efflux system protein
LAIQVTGWLWLDPLTSLLIVFVIIIGTWGLLRDSANLAMDAVPGGIELSKVKETLLALPGVIEVHDLHVWALSTTETALTAHLIQSDAAEDATDDGVGLIALASVTVRKHFRIGHSTFQVETAKSADSCRLRPADVV